MKGSHAFRLVLSEKDWETLLDVCDEEGGSAASAIRRLIRQHARDMRPADRGLRSIADALKALAREVRCLAERRESQRIG
jgi:hypothetical protein